ncbi:MAG: RdgB/HAM1 family non-canonical purine NTP pyrophosphatase [Tidjanibacter sp.]|nr:RdgB/HAM1 family non-canonical purine NTP pyrophosphatase [Tidjanibacter sp.]
MKRIIFATNNAHKLDEVRAILGNTIELTTLKEAGITEDIPENEPTIEGNALAKARYVWERTGCDCFADDTGLEVDALGGAPGVHSARYATDGHDFAANRTKLLREMEGKEHRTARFRTVVALIEGGKESCFEGVVEGEITTSEMGEGGFGYDPLFRPEGYEQTFAELAPEEKNAISHRGRAVAKLAAYLLADK